MITRKMAVQLPTGLEARPLAMLVHVASQYESKIFIEAEDKKINAKSIMGIMGLGLATGEEVVISADGADEEVALDNIENYLSNR